MEELKKELISLIWEQLHKYKIRSSEETFWHSTSFFSFKTSLFKLLSKNSDFTNFSVCAVLNPVLNLRFLLSFYKLMVYLP